MAAGITGNAAVTNSLPPTFIAEVRLADRYKPAVRDTIKNVDLPENEGSTWEMTELTRTTVVALADGEDLATAEQLTDSAFTVVPTRFGGQVVYTNEAYKKFTKRADLSRMVGQVLREDMLRKEDVDILVQNQSYATSIGGAGTSMLIGHIMAAGVSVRSGNQAAGAITNGTQRPPRGKVYGVFNSPMMHTVYKHLALGRQILTTSGASQEGPQPGDKAAKALDAAEVTNVGGVLCMLDENLGKDASDDAKGSVAAQEGTYQVHFLGGVRMSEYVDESRETHEINTFMNKGLGKWQDSYGKVMYFDAAEPTS